MSDGEFSTGEYRLTFSDFNSFFKIWLKKNLFSRRKIFYFVILTIGISAYTAVTLFPIFQDISKSNLNYGLVFWGIIAPIFIVLSLGMSAILVFVILPILTYITTLVGFQLHQFKPARGVTISSDKISKSIGDQIYERDWSSVHDLVETKKTILLFSSPSCATVIPKSTFKTTEDAIQFVHKAKEYWRTKPISP